METRACQPDAHISQHNRSEVKRAPLDGRAVCDIRPHTACPSAPFNLRLSCPLCPHLLSQAGTLCCGCAYRRPSSHSTQSRHSSSCPVCGQCTMRRSAFCSPVLLWSSTC